MKFLESYKLPDSRHNKYQFVIIDNECHAHNYASAVDANSEYPGAFDQHPDYDEEIE